MRILTAMLLPSWRRYVTSALEPTSIFPSTAVSWSMVNVIAFRSTGLFEPREAVGCSVNVFPATEVI